MVGCGLTIENVAGERESRDIASRAVRQYVQRKRKTLAHWETVWCFKDMSERIKAKIYEIYFAIDNEAVSQ